MGDIKYVWRANVMSASMSGRDSICPFIFIYFKKSQKQNTNKIKNTLCCTFCLQ